MGRKRTWTESEAIAVIRSSESWAEVLHRLGLKLTGGNYVTFKQFAADKGLDLSHMQGQGWLAGREKPVRS